MYDELVKRLRAAKAVVFKTEDVTLLDDAADAIEELQTTLCNWCAVCPRDKRDLSTCEIYEKPSCKAAEGGMSMGVYINMEMPKSCGYCPLRHEARDGDECYLGASLTEYQKRPDDCPLVPVQPHGRCVDADKLMQEMRLFIKENMLSRDDARELLETIEDAPTIIPAGEGE